jgi:hypothetical protein
MIPTDETVSPRFSLTVLPMLGPTLVSTKLIRRIFDPSHIPTSHESAVWIDKNRFNEIKRRGSSPSNDPCGKFHASICGTGRQKYGLYQRVSSTAGPRSLVSNYPLLLLSRVSTSPLDSAPFFSIHARADASLPSRISTGAQQSNIRKPHSYSFSSPNVS